MSTSVIIGYYKNHLALSLIRKVFENQSNKDFEALIAIDDSETKTIQFVNDESASYE